MGIPKWTLYAGGAAVVVAGVTAVAVAVASSGAGQPTSNPASAAVLTPSPTPTPTPVDMPHSVAAFGDIAGWSQAPMTAVARVLPQVGDAATGSISAYVDAPVVDGEVTVLESKATVEAGKTYEFSAQMRTLSAMPTPVAATVFVGDTEIDVPDLNAAWNEVTAEYVAPAAAAEDEEASTEPVTSEISVRVVLDGPVAGLGIDDVSLVGAWSDDNVIPNPSFESVEQDDVIINRSLILPAEHAQLAVQVPKGTTTWQAAKDGGDVVASGSAEITRAIDVLPLDGLGQGYYTVTVKDSAGKSTSAKVGLIDYEGTSITADARFGVGLHVEDSWYTDAADLASSLGLGLARNDILWKLNEMTKGQYDWAKNYAHGFDRLHAHGIHLLGIVNYGNKLYGSEKTPETKAAIAAYGKYAAAIAERFDLVALEVFNEFNQDRFNNTACGTDPSCYVPLLKTVHENVRKVDADLPLIAGSTARYDAEWFDGLWKDGGLQYADKISFHPYEVSSNPESLSDVIGKANASMTKNAGDTRPIWITELGTSSKTGGRTVSAQADYLVRTSITAFANGVEKFFWYDLINDSPKASVHEGNFGMYYQKLSGVAALQPKPVGYAQALMVTQLGGREYLDSESLADGVKSYRFGTADDAVRVVWAPGGETSVAIPTDVPLTIARMNGATAVVTPVDGVATITVSARPTFVSAAASAAASASPTASPAVSQSTAP